MLADQVEVVLGGDTHRDRHTLAAVRAFDGALLASTTIPTTKAGYQQALEFADLYAPGSRAWALEGTGSYGTGLVRALLSHDERVIEIDRPRHARRPYRAKNDELDAVRAARTALGDDQHASPRQNASHDALRALLVTRDSAVLARTAAVNALRAMIVTAPDPLRDRFRGLTVVALVRTARRTRLSANAPADHRCVLIAIRSLADRINHLQQEERELTKELAILVKAAAPTLLTQFGVGPVTAAQILVSWAHDQRFRNEAAFAHAAGTAPIAASSGNTTRRRLNRGGDRKLNRALHTILLARRRHDPRTIAYYTEHRKAGKTDREITRILKRYLARAIYRLLQAPAPAPAP